MSLTSAQATVEIVPVFTRGFGAKVKAGVNSVKAPNINVGVQLDRKTLAQAESELRAASARLSKSRDAEATAAERVQVAEAKLASARKSSASGSAELVAAETRLAQARRASVAAQTATQRAFVDDEKARNRVVAANQRLEQSTARTGSALGRFRASLSGINGDGVKKIDRDMTSAVGSASRLGASTFNAASAVTALGSATPVVLGLGAALVTASGAAALLPAALAAAGASFATLKIGTSGIADAFKAQASASAGAAAAGAKSASAQAQQQRQVRDALQGVDQAATQAARTRIDGEKRVADAVDSAAQTQVSGARQVRSAQDEVSTAKKRAADAEKNYRDEVKAATLALRDQKVELKSSSLSVEEAQLSLEQSQQRLAVLKSEGGSDPLGMREAELSVRRASVSLEEAKNRYTDVNRESVRANLYGVQGAQNVREAQQGVIEANTGVRTAEQALAQTRADAASDNVRAQAEIRDAQSQASQANSDAALRVQQAQQQLADAYIKTGDSANSAADKANAALAALSPNAQAFVRSVMGMRGAWDGLKNSVQDKLFAGFAGEVQSLGSALLPTLKSGLTGIAGGFNAAALDASGFLRSAQGVSGIRTVLDNTSTATGNLARAAAPLTSAFLGFAAIGSTFLPGLASGFSNVAEKAAAFVNSAAGAEKIRGWIAGGIEAIKQIGTLLYNVGSVIATVFSTANQVGRSTVGMLNDIVGGFARWLKSAEGTSFLVTMFTGIRDTVNSLRPGVTAISDVIVGFVQAVAPLLPRIGEAFSNIGVAIAPLLRDLGGLITWILPGVISFVNFLAPAAGILAAMAGGVLVVVGAIRAWTIVQGIINVLLSLNPIGLVVLALGALVAGVVYAYRNFEGFRNVVSGVWNFLKTVAGWVAGAFVGVWNFLGTVISNVFSFIKNTAVTIWTSIVTFLSTAISGFRNFFVTIWTAVSNAFAFVWNGIRNTAVTVWEFIKGYFVGAFNFYKSLFMNVWDGILGFFSRIWTGLRDTAVNAWNAIYGFLSRAIEGFAGFFSRAWEGVVNGFRTTWTKLQDLAKAPVRFVIDTVLNAGIGGLWNKVADLFGLGKWVNFPLPAGFAIGGRVNGPGTGTSDSIPAMLSNGEHVLTAAEVRAMGGHEAVIDMRERVLRRATGGPVTWQEQQGVINRQFPSARITSAFRPGDKGYHGAGKAIDIAGARPMDMRAMLDINRWIASNFGSSAELIHTAQGAVNIKNGSPHTYSGGIQADHRDHVHWANNGGNAGGLKGLIDSVFSWVKSLGDKIAGPESWLRGMVKPAGAGEPAIAGLPFAAMNKILTTAKDWLFGKANQMDAGGMVDGGPTSGDMLGNARVIGNVGRQLGFGRNGIVVALATALQESGLRNINYGDRDSVGLFQQRASQGWGSVAQIMNPSYAASKFFSALRGVKGWERMPVTVAAQRVQRSGFPDAYAKWTGKANSLASQIGFARGGVVPGISRGRDDKLALVSSQERVLSERQNIAFEALAGVSGLRSQVPASIIAGRDLVGVGARPVSKTIHTEFSGDIRESVDIDSALNRAAFLSARL